MKKIVKFRHKALLEKMIQKYGDEKVLDQILALDTPDEDTEFEEDFPPPPEECSCDDEEECFCDSKKPCKNHKKESSYELNDKILNCILEFIKKLEGYRLRAKEFHWNFDSVDHHFIRDEFISFLTGDEDAIAEDMMGYFGIRIKPGMIVGVLPKSMNPTDMLDELRFDIIKMKRCIEGCIECSGISNILDEMMHRCNKFKYLESKLEA